MRPDGVCRAMQSREEGAGVIAQPAVVYSDKDQTFLNVIRAFGMALFALLDVQPGRR